MSPLIPVELWTLIAKYAIAPVVNANRFNPPVGNFDRIQGFAETSTTFRDIVKALKYEVLIVSFADIPHISRSSARRVKCLEVTDIGVAQSVFGQMRHSPGTSILNKIRDFSQLTSLSIRPYEEPMQFLDRLQSLPISRTLRSLDVHAEWAVSFKLGIYPRAILQSTTLSFPNLLRLRFFGQPVCVVNPHILSDIASFLSDCGKLQLLSLHVTLDVEPAVVEQSTIHRTSLEHLQPSEGYERDITDCPLCMGNYDHGRVVQRENSATRLLAQKLPSLSEVRWTHFWARNHEDESGQRRTKVTRQGGDIILTRDDGKGG